MTDTHDKAQLIRQHITAIASAWPNMLPDAPHATIAGTIGRHDPQPPVPAHVLDIRRDTLTRLKGWATVCIVDLDLHPHIDASDAVPFCRFLNIHADHLAQHDAADAVLDQLADSADRCLRVAEPPAALEFIGRCDRCGGDLRARDGGWGRCRDCGNVVDTETTRRTLTAEAEDRLMTAAELVTLARRMWDGQVNHVRLHRWVKAGRLAVHGHIRQDGRDRALHRVGDVTRIVGEHQQTGRAG